MSISSITERRIESNFEQRVWVSEIVEKVYTWYLTHVQSGPAPRFPSQKTLRNMAKLDITDSGAFRFTKKLSGLLLVGMGGFSDAHMTKDEILKFWQIFFDHVRPLYRGQYKRLKNKFNKNPETKHLELFFKCFNFHADHLKDIFPKVYQVALNQFAPYLSESQKRFADILPDFVRQFPGMKQNQYKAQFQSIFDEMLKSQLDEYRQRTGVSVSSQEEMFRHKTHRSIEEFASYRTHSSASDLLQELVRSYFGRSFLTSVKIDLAKKTDSAVIKAFNKLIADYISPTPTSEWRFNPRLNFGYAAMSIEKMFIATPEDETKHLDARLAHAKLFLQALEMVYQEFVDNQQVLRGLKNHLATILFAKDDVWFDHFMIEVGPSPYSYPASAGLLEALLRDLVKKHPRLFTEDIRQKLLFFKLNLSLLAQMQLPPAAPSSLTSEEQQLLDVVHKHFDDALKECYETAQKLVKPDAQKELPIVGIGFSGPLFDIDPTHRASTLYVSYTHKFTLQNSIAGQAFLTGASLLLGEWRFSKRVRDQKFFHFATNQTLTTDFTLITPFNDPPSFHNRIFVLEEPEPDDLNVLNYIGKEILNQICTDPTYVHPDIRASYQARIETLLRSEIHLLQAKKMKWEKEESSLLEQLKAVKCSPESPESQVPSTPIEKQKTASQIKKLQLKLDQSLLEKDKIEPLLQLFSSALTAISSGSFTFPKQVFDFIENQFSLGENRICLETTINHLAGTPYTLSFARGPTNVPPITYQGSPFSFSGNTLIQPCSQRCQLMSGSHALCGELHNFSTAQQMDTRKRKATGAGLTAYY